MEQKHERPEFIRNFKKPQATEVKHINGHWYLYERKTKYDPSTKKSRKVSGKLLGTITEFGLVPRQTKVTDAFDLEVREFGAFQYFYEHTQAMREKLMEYFPGSWKRIYTIAILRTVYGCRFKRIEAHYQDSIASLAYPSLALSSSSLTPLLRNLGRNREAIRLFMGSIRGDKGRYILVDGHRILSSSKTVDHAQLGYDSKMRYKPQINLIYLFSLGDGCAFPEYYKQYGGSITDVSAFSDILAEAGIDEDDVTFVGDKGFMSQANCSLLEDSSLRYIIPLKRGNTYVQGKVPPEPLQYNFSFTYHGRSIFASTFAFEDCHVHLFRDTVLFDSEMGDLIARGEKCNSTVLAKAEKERRRRAAGKGRLSDKALAALVPTENALQRGDVTEMGTLSIKTNRKELNAHQVYAIYKQRQAIEQYFKTYGDTMNYDDSYLRSNESFEGWLFLNHLSLMMTVNAIEEIYLHGKEKDISFEDLRQLLTKVRANKFANDWHPCKKTQKVISLCESLDINIKEISVPYSRSAT